MLFRSRIEAEKQRGSLIKDGETKLDRSRIGNVDELARIGLFAAGVGGNQNVMQKVADYNRQILEAMRGGLTIKNNIALAA